MPKGSVTTRLQNSEPRVRRGYFECRYGQLHVHNAIPPGGGFEEGTALLCLHGTAGHRPRTSSVSCRCWGATAPFTLRTFPAAANPTAPPASQCPRMRPPRSGDFLDSMRFRQIDVLGYQSGSLIAAELAIARPQQVRRVVLVGVPATTEGERLRQIGQPVLVARAKDELLGFHRSARGNSCRAPGRSICRSSEHGCSTPAPDAIGSAAQGISWRS